MAHNIVNIRDFEPRDRLLIMSGMHESIAYVGRRSGTDKHFGNPFTHLEHETRTDTVQLPTREDAIDAFESWLVGWDNVDVQRPRRLWMLSNLHTLRDKTLACWCAPQPCHAEFLADHTREITLYVRCPHCNERGNITVDTLAFSRWFDGTLLAQEAFPNHSKDERETLLSGLCPPCWSEITAPLDDDPEDIPW